MFIDFQKIVNALTYIKNESGGHSCDNSDEIYCNHCGEAECELDCISVRAEFVNSLKTVEYSQLAKFIIDVSHGSFYNAVCSHIHIEGCSFCGEFDEHEDDCPYIAIKEAIGLNSELDREQTEQYLKSEKAKSEFNTFLIEHSNNNIKES